MNYRLRLGIILILGFLANGHVRSEDVPAPASKIVKSPGIEIDFTKREISVDATVCLERGILEYLVCLPDTFEHEAIFSTRCKPSALHFNLFLIGLEPYEFNMDEDWFAQSKEK